MRLLIPLCLTLALAPALPSAPRWAPTGHRVIARIAEARLRPDARAAARDLLDGLSLADVSIWADSVRPHRPATAPWHYVNIPVTDSAFVPDQHCPNGQCVIAAIERFRRVLADRQAPRAERAEALRFLVHFVGDMHQPLHVGDNRDRGGNDLQVQFMGSGSNLHRVWDGGLIDALGVGEETLVARQLDRLGRLDEAALAAGSVTEWAMEGHARSRDHAYALVPADRRLGAAYVQAQAGVIEDALLAGGVRLARVLNEALGPRP